MAVTVNLQGVLTVCTHVWDLAGAGICEHATFGSVKGHLKVIARSKFHKFKYFFVWYKPSHIVHFWIGAMYRNIDHMCGSSPESREVKSP